MAVNFMQTQTQTPEPASPIAGLLTRDQLAQQLGIVPRTVWAWERAGLPCIRVSRLRLYDPAAVRSWMTAIGTRQEVRKPGRPRKLAA